MLDKIYNYFGMDGLLHIICSIIIVRFSDLFLPLWTAALIAAVIGVSKEIIWDKLLKKGTFDKYPHGSVRNTRIRRRCHRESGIMNAPTHVNGWSA